MIRLIYDTASGECDFSCTENEGTDVSRPIETAALLSIFCDAKARVHDPVPAGTDRRGWWAEAFFDEPDDWGSRLWQVLLGKATKEALAQAQRTCRSALQWMIDDGYARDVAVQTWWLEGRQGYMGISIQIFKPDTTEPQYIGPWEVYYAMG